MFPLSLKIQTVTQIVWAPCSENNILFSHVKRLPLLWFRNKSHLSQRKVKWFDISLAFSLAFTNGALHGRLEIRNFSTLEEKFRISKRQFIDLDSPEYVSAYDIFTGEKISVAMAS